jgi:hypothetical protein
MTERKPAPQPKEPAKPVIRPVYPVPPQRPVNEGLIDEIQKGQKPPAERR